MKKQLLLWTITWFIALSLLSCSTDTMPEEEATDPTEETSAPDSYHDKVRDKPYPKADNELYINPSPLIVPQKLKTSDYLQFALSRNNAFNESETITSEPMAWCMFNPHQALEAGNWYWRFRSISKNGTQDEWSEILQFEVKAETPKFVTPSFNNFYNNIPHVHPRLYCFLDNNIDEARRTVTSHPEYKTLTARATSALNADYTNVPNPYDKAEEIKTYITYLYQAYHLTQKPEYREKILKLLRLMLSYPVSDEQLFATNFGSTDIAIIFIEGYDIAYDKLTHAERTGAEELIMRVARHYYKMYCGMQENHIFDNHFWQHNMRVLFQAAFILSDKSLFSVEAAQMLEYYYELWTARAPDSGYNRDGLWRNGAGYFSANVKTLYYMPLLCSYLTGKDFLQHPWYQNAGKAITYAWPPQSKSAGFGDSSEKGNEPERQRIAFADFLARETGDAYAGWYATECRKTLLTDYEFRLYRMASGKQYATSKLPEGSPKLIWHKDAGEVTIHSNIADTENNLSLSFRSSTFGSGSHTLANQNCFNLLYKGIDVYRSTGYYQNFSDAHNIMSYRHTRAHNTLLVNGIGQPFSMKGYGNVVRAIGGERISYCLGDASNAYSGISEDPMWIDYFAKAGITQTPENGFGETPLSLYRRHVLVLHPNIVILYDELEADSPVRWEWLLHSPHQFRIDYTQRKMTTIYNNKQFTSIARQFSNQSCSISQTEQFVVPPTIASAEYPNQWHLTAAYGPSEKNRILTIIQVVADAGEAFNIEQREDNVFKCGTWTIRAMLDGSLPASLSVTSNEHSSMFSYGSDNPLINRYYYTRQHKQSSILFDEMDGKDQTIEMTDYSPASTRAIVR